MKYLPLLIAVIFIGCKENKLFERLPAKTTGIAFNNTIVENDTLHPLKEVNIYNGGGVGAGDFNNDGLIDLYFTGNMVENKLYLNKGDFRFQDITSLAGVNGGGLWSRGVAVVDINSDGLDDIYVCTAISKDPEKRKNLLYINQGTGDDGIPRFTEAAAAYGLDDTTHTAMAYFFDYDNDNDLDVYLVVNHHLSTENQNNFRPIRGDGSHPSTGRLYRNDFDSSKGHPVFTNVSKEAGITIEGYGHAAVIADFNLDGWKDIYVTNDFAPSNILYINNRNGTFTDSTQQYIKQTSRFAMGVDMQDLDNDGLSDIVELDMNPEDNFRKKMMLEANSYQTMQNFNRYKYQHQYIRNTLQHNQGRPVRSKDSLGNFVFSQVGYQSGIAETDWSWTPIVIDFDNDGYRDIIITNGYPKDITDHDFMIYREKASLVAKTEDLLRQVPEVKLRNYAYRNNGDLTFQNYSFAWGLDDKTFATGGIYADLDNDGDMDLIINNINQEASVYRNHADKNQDHHFLNLKLQGEKFNRAAFGALVQLYYDGKLQVAEHSPYRGYVSTHQNIVHFGLGSHSMIDSLVVIWPDARKQVLTGVAANQTLVLDISNANQVHSYDIELVNRESIFRNVTDSLGMNFVHSEFDYPDFIIQKLMPHKFTEYSPALAAGDVNGDGLDDIILGGTSAAPTRLFIQQSNGNFAERKLFASRKKEYADPLTEFYGNPAGSDFKDAGILLFDADGDGDNDLYIAAGGYAYEPNSDAYRDRFYINKGNGVFVQDTNAIPASYQSKFCVRAFDYDGDGDLDLFVAGRVEPAAYPKPVSSMLLRNDSKKDLPKFTDVTSEVAPDLINIGLICDAVFSDFDNDGSADLVLAGEFMPLTFLRYQNGKFVNIGEASGVHQLSGWWNSIAPGDFDNDGDIDYVVGNLGLNTFFKASPEYPLTVVGKDFDANGSFDAFVAKYMPVSHDDTTLKCYPVHTRDELIKQMIGFRRKYVKYKSYAGVTMEELFTPEEMEGAVQLKANTFTSAYFRNDGGKFVMVPLPKEAQAGVIQAMVVEDFDGDGHLDVVINGNDYGMDVSYGRMDALNGLLLKGDGQGNFQPQSLTHSGIFIPGNGKALVQFRNREGAQLLAASQHNGPLQVFALRKETRSVPLAANDISAVIRYTNGKIQKRERYYGYSFLSQSAAFISVYPGMESIEITNNRGEKRVVTLN